ncbi:MAG: DUF72 domain-containing protein [Caldimicrobium sp.]|jgi:uncharacterized protein YecE (DUF72 family)
MKYYIGTSGWSYYSFKGLFYPPELKPKDWLKFYSTYLNTVEINATFYRTPRPSTFIKWYEETPPHFVFSVKAPKIITHIKRLKEVEEPLQAFLKSISPLKEKAEVLLFQLPPSLPYEKNLIEPFLKLLPVDKYRCVIEIRHQSFHNKEFIQLLKSYGVCLCFSDCGKRYPSWYEVQTVDFLYLRLHGSPELYVSNYEEEDLEKIVQLIHRFKVKEVFVYFDNTARGYAITNALTLQEKLKNKVNNITTSGTKDF